MKNKHLILLFILIYGSTLITSCISGRNCPEDINLLPMYGNAEKCKEQLEADEIFLKEIDEQEPNRQIAAMQMLENSWYYLRNKDYDTAMKRANLAWLLDSTSIEVYITFTSILDITQKTEEAMQMLDLTLSKLNTSESSSTRQEFTDEYYLELMTNSIMNIYLITNNPSLVKYFYQKIDDLNISQPDKNKLKSNIHP